MLNLHVTISEGKSIGSNPPKKEIKKRAQGELKVGLLMILELKVGLLMILELMIQAADG
jgi:hypothetical protein